MEISFRWWLSNSIAKALKSLSEEVFILLETRVFAVFKAARIGWATETGLAIFWEDINIKPPVDEALKRRFLQQYNNFLSTAGTVQNDELLKDFFDLVHVYSIDMRDHELMSHLYPYHVVRFWIPQVDANMEKDIRSILEIILPARCIKHYQLLTWHESKGFGRTPFGRRFGR
ncbi:hypothetical protein KJ966_24545 [bacterium]|nr:hypothetical protein [bacterium]